jgi:hypothetical protein
MVFHVAEDHDNTLTNRPRRMPTSNAVSRLTVAQYLQTLWPHTKGDATELYWPPNMFAFTSLLFEATGCYRGIVSARSVQSRRLRRQRTLEKEAANWLEWLSRVLEGKKASTANRHATPIAFKRIASVVTDAKHVTMNELRIIDAAGSPQRSAEFVDKLVDLHAIADIACTQFGLLGGGRRASCVAKCLAELMLTAMGTMSTLPKHFGVVLPKMRTPQTGLSVRSLSHHLAFSSTEVEVAWRCFPWLNEHENSVNALLLPWPMIVRDSQFRESADSLEVVRYFDYAPAVPVDMVGVTMSQSDTASIVDEILKRVECAQERVARLHMVILPELALCRTDFETLLERLAERSGENGRARLPLIIAGTTQCQDVAHQNGTQSSSCAGVTRAVNEVQLAAYFAGRWYRLSQRKHHRWKLDRKQIMQYGLQARLGAARGAFERMDITQRRLGFFSPTGWMAMCPLICEDLAQLEPVSEVIRAVGPTFLVALLLDGPQLRERWSARYASVLADDPGTTVLTLTSAGMAARSVAPVGETRTKPAQPADAAPGVCVGLWRDAVDGWREIRLPDGDDAILLSMSALRREEYTADGRSDGGAAALIRFDGYSTFRCSGHKLSELSGAVTPAIRKWDDLRELASATHALDATLYLGKDSTLHVRNLVMGFSDGTGAAKEHVRHLPGFLQSCVIALWHSQRNPQANGTNPGDATGRLWESDELRAALNAIDVITNELATEDAYKEDHKGNLDTLGVALALAKKAIHRLESRSASDTKAGPGTDTQWATYVALPTMILTLLHERLQRYRGHNDVAPEQMADFSPDRRVEEVAELLRLIECSLRAS